MSSAARTYRLREFDVTTQPGVNADELAYPEFQAVCITGDNAACGQTSGLVEDVAEVTEWMARHTRDTGHQQFRHAYWVYVTVEPGAWK
ncbi:hypothetical protein [Streptomyces sp. MBT53]|uniref:DUF7848 domain-containing protein n=1 Tax=Streptomyces sp. MBT53 TaxID=1488384 RepID=UPI0019125616|nr:hypothetical protein [Streptomyces sp. MBT53]MBK6015816.1 hypothetical protein [Streptomyces sp. MBT53]